MVGQWYENPKKGIYIIKRDQSSQQWERRLLRVVQVKLSPCNNIQSSLNSNASANSATTGSIPAQIDLNEYSFNRRAKVNGLNSRQAQHKKPSLYTWPSLILTPLGLSFCVFGPLTGWLAADDSSAGAASGGRSGLCLRSSEIFAVHEQRA